MTFAKLLEELSGALGIPVEDAGGACALQAEGYTVVLQLAGGPDGDILFTHADLGEIPPDRRPAVAKAALEANYLYRGTGGATLALDPATGHLHLQRYDWLDRLEKDKAFEVLGRFADTAAAWKRLAFEETPDAAPAVGGGLPPEGFLRV